MVSNTYGRGVVFGGVVFSNLISRQVGSRIYASPISLGSVSAAIEQFQRGDVELLNGGGLVHNTHVDRRPFKQLDSLLVRSQKRSPLRLPAWLGVTAITANQC